MNNFKKWTATALALSLCLTLAACSSDDGDTTTSTPATSTSDSAADNSATADETTGEEGTEAGAEAGEEGAEAGEEGAEAGEATLDSYLTELMAFNEAVGLVEEKLVESGDSGEGVPADQEAIDLQIEIMTAMSEAMATASDMTAPAELAELHADFVTATEELIAAAEATCEFLADGFDAEDEEALATYEELGDVYLYSYGPLSEALVAIMNELEAQAS